MAEKKYPGNAEGEKKLSDLIAAGKPTAKNATVTILLFWIVSQIFFFYKEIDVWLALVLKVVKN